MCEGTLEDFFLSQAEGCVSVFDGLVGWIIMKFMLCLVCLLFMLLVITRLINNLRVYQTEYLL